MCSRDHARVEVAEDRLDVLSRLITEGEQYQIEEVQFIASLIERGQSPAGAEAALREVEGTLVALRAQRSVLQGGRRP